MAQRVIFFGNFETSLMWFSNFNYESIVTPCNFSWELAAREIPSTETISSLLALSKIWDFPGLAFKWLFLSQWKSLVAEACTSNGSLGMSVAHETVLCHQRNLQH